MSNEDARTGRILDAHGLQALAHPLRVRILSLLGAEGPATSAILAERLQVRTGTTSWHLQKLAERGFIEDMPDQGNRRERWWRVVTPDWSVNPAQFMDDPELADATAVLLTAVIAQHTTWAMQFYSEDWSPEWRAASILNTFELSLDPVELAALREDLYAVIHRYVDHPSAEAGAERVVFQMQGFPQQRKATP